MRTIFSPATALHHTAVIEASTERVRSFATGVGDELEEPPCKCEI